MSDDRETGYVRLHRQIMSSELWRETPHCRVVALTLVMHTEWRPGGSKVPHPETRELIHVPRGYVLIGLRPLATATGITLKATRIAVHRLLEIAFVVRTDIPALYHVPGYERFNPLKRLAETQNTVTARSDFQESISQKTAGGDPPGEPGGDPPGGSGLVPSGDQAWYPQGIRQAPLSISAVKKDKHREELVAPKSPPPLEKTDTFCLEHPVPPRPKADPDHIAAVLTAYDEGIEARYRFKPTKHSMVDHSHARDLVLQYGHVRAIELARGYPGVEDPFLQRQGHPFRLLRQNLNAVEIHLRGLGPRKKFDSTRIPTDPRDPRYLEPL